MAIINMISYTLLISSFLLESIINFVLNTWNSIANATNIIIFNKLNFVLSKVVKYNPFKTIEIIFTANAYISTSNAIKFQNDL